MIGRWHFSNEPSHRSGFFQANWTTEEASHSLRGAIIEPSNASMADSPLRSNHAYPWDLLVSLAQRRPRFAEIGPSMKFDAKPTAVWQTGRLTCASGFARMS
jgi:hypothetical protein